MLFKWKRRKRRKKSVRLRVSNIKELFRKFETNKINYVVLRWFDEVPLTPKEETDFGSDNDIDILIDTEDIKLLASIASQHPGKIRCDLFNPTGRRGLSFSKMPYYPPTLASLIISKSQRYKDSFNIPEPLTYFRSLAYHLTYHKGLYSGITTGCHLKSFPDAKRDYGKLLAELGQSLNIEIEQPYTLLAIHEYLQKTEWSMPFDLLKRWPQKSEWLDFLLQQESEQLKPWAEKLPHLMVFFVRQDIIEYGKTETVYKMLSEKFHIIKKEELKPQQTQRVLSQVRGGNWVAHNGTWTITPKIAVICYDFNPVTPDTDDQEKMKNYPHVENKNIFHKHDIRLRLAKTSDTPDQVFGIHGSDNAYEAQNMLHAIYAEKTPQINQEIFESLQKK